MQIQETAIIRQRGQLTIPDKIREKFEWIQTDSVISIKTTSNNEILLQPYKPKTAKKLPKRKK